MTAKLLDGKKVAEKILAKVKEEILKLRKKRITPTLAIILVGQNPESLIYIREKRKKAKELQINSRLYRLAQDIKEESLINLIQKLNQDPKVHGILVQLPLPVHLDSDKVLGAVEPKKEVDGLTFSSSFKPACASGILEILSFYRIPFKNKKIIILGKGRLVGKPLSELLKKEGVFALVCDRKTKNISALTKKADILVSALRTKDFVTKKMVKRNAVVIDAAKNVKEEVKDMAGYLTPEIGGVGPVTVAMLLKNVVEAARTSALDKFSKSF